MSGGLIAAFAENSRCCRLPSSLMRSPSSCLEPILNVCGEPHSLHDITTAGYKLSSSRFCASGGISQANFLYKGHFWKNSAGIGVKRPPPGVILGLDIFPSLEKHRTPLTWATSPGHFGAATGSAGTTPSTTAGAFTSEGS